MSQRRRLVAVIGWLLALCAALAINIPIAIAVAAVFTLYRSVRGMVAEIQLVAFRPKTLDADPEKVRQLEEEMGFALPTLDDADIKTLVQQVQDATGLSQDKAIAYVANDLERPTNAIQAIVNPIKAALPRSDDRSWSPPSRNRFDKLAVPPHMFVPPYMFGERQPPVAAVAMLVDINGDILKIMPLPPPPWPTSGDRFRCPDKLVYQARETVMTRGFRIRVGDIQTPVTRFNDRSTVTMKSPDILKVEMCVEQEIYDELCRQYASREKARLMPPGTEMVFPLSQAPEYIYPIGKEVKW
jgi:hypothetical protein